MGNVTDKNNINDEVTLKVFKDSPQVWAGGLEGRDLACWLIARANAILFMDENQEKRNAMCAELVRLNAYALLIQAYADLGLSRLECDPIRSLSKEAIQFDIQSGHRVRTHQSNELNQVVPIPFPEFSQLPDLSEVQEEYQRMKVAALGQGPIPCEKKQDD